MKSFRKLLNLSRLEWPILLLGVVFLVFSSAALLIYPYIIKTLIDEALVEKNKSDLNSAALLTFLVFALQALTSALRYFYFSLAGERTVKRLRSSLFNNIIAQEMTFFDKQRTGELVGRLSSDTAVLQNALSVNISMILRYVVQTFGALTMLFLSSAKLTVFVLIIIPPLGFLAAKFGKRVRGIAKRSQDALANSTGVAEESIGTIRTVKSFSQENQMGRIYKECLEKSFELSRRKLKVIANFSFSLNFIGFSTLVFIIWYGGQLVISNEITVGTLTSYLLYMITLAFSVGMLGSLWTDFQSAIGASERVFELLERPVEEKKSGLNVISDSSIEFKDVSFSYPSRSDHIVLKKLSLTISPHEAVAIVGASGAGKSTIVQLLLRFYEIAQGEILIGKKNIKNYSLECLRTQIGIVSQEPVLSSVTLEENIRYSNPFATESEILNASKQAFAHDFISAFPEKYKTMVGERGIQLSGGQKQRVAIARALLKKPKILILDEATSALDSESECLVQRALDMQRGLRTTLIIAHRISTVKNADKIIVMQDGAIVQVGKHDQLYNDRNSIYYSLVKNQFAAAT